MRWRPSLNQKLGIIAGILVLAALVMWGVIIWAMSQQATVTNEPPRNTTNNLVKANNPVSNESLPRQLDGVFVEGSQATIWPISLMIENAAFGGVRPQFGLSYAQVVYELPVEGGITRFMAVFSGDMPDKIGPIRSARPTYLEFNAEFDGLYGHAGGSPEALQAVSGLAVKELSALGADSRFFYRDLERVAPHNLFTSGEQLDLARRDKGLAELPAEFTVWSFKEDEPSHLANTAPFIIDFGSGPLYSVSYRYDDLTNSYERSNGGEVQTDANTGKPLMVKNVVVQLVPAGIPAGADGRVNYNVTGSGKAYIARDGRLIEGTWTKSNRDSRTIFTDATGQEVAFDRGSIWISILPANGSVTLPQ